MQWAVQFYWISPSAHALYGLTSSQQGDVAHEYVTQVGSSTVSVETYISQYFGFKHSLIGYNVLVLCGFVILLRIVAVFALKHINWQQR